jgi:hypothetical protein
VRCGTYESSNVADPEVRAQEIVEDIEAAFEPFREIAMDLRKLTQNQSMIT